MAGTLGTTNTQVFIPLVFPGSEQGVGGQGASLGQFLYWADMAAGNLVAYDATASIIGAVTTRPESLVRAHFHVDRVDDDLPLQEINGIPAMGPSSGGTNMLEAQTTVGVVSQVTFFMVVSKLAAVSPVESLVKFNGSNAFHVKNSEVTVGGASHAYDSTEAALTFADNLPHIVVIKWDGFNVFAKVGESEFELVGIDATLKAGNPTTLYIGGTTGTGTSGCIGEVMISADSMTNAEINAVGTYLCNKWRLPWADLTV